MDETVGNSVTDIPIIDASKLFSEDVPSERKVRTRRIKNSDIIVPLEMTFSFLYSLPAMSGYGKHWELKEEEANHLAVQLKEVLDAYPSKSIQEFLKLMQKLGPVVIFAVAMWGITKPRLNVTRQLIAELKLKRENDENRRAKESGIHAVN